MTTTFSELQTMQDSLSGGTTNLLRMARSGCGCAVAFVALALEDKTFATARYSSTPDEGLVGREALDELVTQIWQDPRLARGEAVTRSVRLGGRWGGRGAAPLAVAVVPLGEGSGEPWGMVGVADPGDKIFGPSDIELLGRIARRMASYLRARHEVQQAAGGTAAAPPSPTTPPPATAASAAGGADRATRSELWWSVEPGGTSAGGTVGAPPHGAPEATGTGAGTPGGRGGTPPAAPTWAALAAEAADELRWTLDAGQQPGGAVPPAAPVSPRTPPSAPPPPAPPSFRARVVAESPTQTPLPAGPPARATVSPAAPAGPTAPAAPAAPAGPTAPRGERAAVPPEAGAGSPGGPSTIESGFAAVGTAAGPDPYRVLLAEEELPPGLIPVGALLGRTGRLLGAGGSSAGSLAVVAVELEGAAGQVEDVLPAAVRELRAQLRFDDPLARVGRTVFCAVVPLVPGGSSGELVEARLAEALRTAAAGRELQVRSAHVVGEIRASHDADELLRSAVGKLRAD